MAEELLAECSAGWRLVCTRQLGRALVLEQPLLQGWWGDGCLSPCSGGEGWLSNWGGLRRSSSLVLTVSGQLGDLGCILGAVPPGVWEPLAFPADPLV